MGLSADATAEQNAAAPAADAQAAPSGWTEELLDAGVQIIDLGGPVVMVLLALSVFGLTIVFMKLWQFAGIRAAHRKAAEGAVRLWQRGDHAGAQRRIESASGPVARVIATVIETLNSGRPEQHAREAVEQQARNEIADLRSNVRGIEIVAQAAPLIGLLGTVLGMIEAFRALEASGGDVDPAGLAGGIWVALLTTAVGLSVAIPFSIALAWIDGRIARERRVMETLATEVLTSPPASTPAMRDQGAPGAPATVAREAHAAHAH